MTMIGDIGLTMIGDTGLSMIGDIVDQNKPSLKSSTLCFLGAQFSVQNLEKESKFKSKEV